MPKWSKPSEELPECEAGDRVLLIVCERETSRSPFRPKMVILEATEDGWYSPDETYTGYFPSDSVLWAYEKNVCEIAHALDLVPA